MRLTELLARCIRAAYLPALQLQLLPCFATSERKRTADGNKDISILDSKVLEYRPNETALLVTDSVLQADCRKVSIRALAREAGVAEKTVKAARRGQRLRRSTIGKLVKGLGELS